MLAALATLGFGGAMGLEGPSLYLGSSIGTFLQQRFRRLAGGADRRLLLVAGAAAGVAAIFKAPATGAIFAIEVPYQDDLARRMLLPALVAAATSYLTFVADQRHRTDPARPREPGLHFADLAGAVALGVLAGIGARGFAWILRHAKHIATTRTARAAGPRAGLTIAAIFGITQLLTHEPITIGVGYATISWALGREPRDLAPPRHPRAALPRHCGDRGRRWCRGLFIPLVVAGALLGRAVGGVVGDLNTSLFLVIGVAAFLGAGYRVPLAAVMFVAESTGRPGFVVPGLLAAVTAELMMGRSSVTAYQRATTARRHRQGRIRPPPRNEPTVAGRDERRDPEARFAAAGRSSTPPSVLRSTSRMLARNSSD